MQDTETIESDTRAQLGKLQEFLNNSSKICLHFSQNFRFHTKGMVSKKLNSPRFLKNLQFFGHFWQKNSDFQKALLSYLKDTITIFRAEFGIFGKYHLLCFVDLVVIYQNYQIRT